MNRDLKESLKKAVRHARIIGLGSMILFSTTVLLNAQETEEDEEEVFNLSPFEVSGDAVVGYVSRETLSGAKTAQRLIDVPAAVTVVTKDFIDDTLSYDRVIDALQMAVPGIQNIGPKQPNYLIRGFRSKDHGIDGLAQRGLQTLPMTFVESVEVLKGPSAMMYGAFADIGGYVNRNLVRPLRAEQYKAGVVAGSDSFMMAYADATGPIRGAEWIQYRFNAEYLDREFPWNDSNYRTRLAYRLSVNFDLNRTTALRVSVMKWEDETRADRAPINPATGKIVDNVSVSGPGDASFSQNDTWFTQIDLTASPSEYFSFTMKYHWENATQAAVFVRANDPSPKFTDDDSPFLYYRQANWSLPFGVKPGEDVSGTNPNQVTHHFETIGNWNWQPEKLPFESTFTFGGGVTFEQRDQDRWDTRRPGGNNAAYDTSLVPDTDVNGGGIFDMRNGSPLEPLSANPWWRQDASQDKGYAFYNERLSFLEGMVQLVYGQRWDHVESGRFRWPSTSSTEIEVTDEVLAGDQTDYVTPTRTFSNVSKRYGVIYKPVESIAIFHGYSESFQDQGAGAVVGGGLTPPQTAIGEETGIKFDLWKGFSGSVSYFDMRVTDRARNDPDNVGFKVIDTQDIVNEGWEATLAWQYEGWTVLGNYYTGEVIDTADNTLDPNQYLSMWNAWVKYRFSDSSTLEGLSLGLGVSHNGTKIGRRGIPNQPSSTFYDAFISYQMDENWRFRLSGSNIFDEYSIGLIATDLRVGYGRPQEFKISAEYTF